MRRFFLLILATGLILLLFAAVFFFVRSPVKPVISFVGVSTGTLTTDLSKLKFQDRFSAKDKNIVGVVSFARVANETHVQAYWFSPDDRRPPLGMSVIDVVSGATIARFSLSTSTDWRPAPYMFQILATTKGRGKTQLVASGSTHFYIGMTDEQVTAYENEYQAWQEAEAKERVKAEREQQEKKEKESKSEASSSGPSAATGSLKKGVR